MSRGEMRPSRVTAEASTMTRATPPTAREPRWTRCQLLAMPSFLSRILAHRRHGDAIAEGDLADRQRAQEVDLGHLPVVVAARPATRTVKREARPGQASS